MPKIHSRTLPDGTRRWSFRVDVGRGPDGKRVQEYHTFTRRSDAVAELARIMAEAGRGMYVRPSRETLGEHLDGWLEGVTRDLRASTGATTPTRSGRYASGSAGGTCRPSPGPTSRAWSRGC